MWFYEDIDCPIIDDWMLAYRAMIGAFFFWMTFRTEAIIAARDARTILAYATISPIKCARASSSFASSHIT
jgi:hypothetical protein